MNAYRKQQLAAAALIEQGATAEQVAAVYGWTKSRAAPEQIETGDKRILTPRRKCDIIKAIRRHVRRWKRKQEGKTMKIYEITDIKAIAERAGDTEPQSSVLVHEKADKFRSGDCILFGYSSADFENDSDVLTALQNETPESDFLIDKHGIYHA